jgi:hypothetical protein
MLNKADFKNNLKNSSKAQKIMKFNIPQDMDMKKLLSNLD